MHKLQFLGEGDGLKARQFIGVHFRALDLAGGAAAIVSILKMARRRAVVTEWVVTEDFILAFAVRIQAVHKFSVSIRFQSTTGGVYDNFYIESTKKLSFMFSLANFPDCKCKALSVIELITSSTA